MTDRQFTAKQWLNRLQTHDEILKAERRTLEMLEAKLYKGVAIYEGSGAHIDAFTAHSAQEDALADYSAQIDRIQAAENAYLKEVEQTHKIIEQIPEELQAVAIDRYINGISWEKLEIIHCYSRSSLMRHNLLILDSIADILSATTTELTLTAQATAAG